MGGLVVIDFIDMESQKNQREVESRFKEALHHDRARVQTGKISRFGLLELSRQRLRPSIGESSNSICTKCNGTGSIRDIQSTALHILRMIQEEAMKEHNATISAQLPIEVATFLLNEKRSDIFNLEQRLKVEITLIPNKHLESPNYSISSTKQEDVLSQSKPSYQMMESLSEGNQVLSYKQPSNEVKQEPLVKGIVPDSPAPSGAGNRINHYLVSLKILLLVMTRTLKILLKKNQRLLISRRVIVRDHIKIIAVEIIAIINLNNIIRNSL